MATPAPASMESSRVRWRRLRRAAVASRELPVGCPDEPDVLAGEGIPHPAGDHCHIMAIVTDLGHIDAVENYCAPGRRTGRAAPFVHTPAQAAPPSFWARQGIGTVGNRGLTLNTTPVALAPAPGPALQATWAVPGAPKSRAPRWVTSGTPAPAACLHSGRKRTPRSRTSFSAILPSRLAASAPSSAPSWPLLQAPLSPPPHLLGGSPCSPAWGSFLLEVSLFCLVTHLEFRNVLPTDSYAALNTFCQRFATRASVGETPYRFDP
jgi:hypothetical protein